MKICSIPLGDALDVFGPAVKRNRTGMKRRFGLLISLKRRAVFDRVFFAEESQPRDLLVINYMVSERPVFFSISSHILETSSSEKTATLSAVSGAIGLSASPVCVMSQLGHKNAMRAAMLW